MKSKRYMLLIVVLIGCVGVASGNYLARYAIIGLNLDKKVEVVLEGTLPFTTHLEKLIEVSVRENLAADVRITKELDIPLKETLEIPLQMTIKVPVATDMFVDQLIHLNMTVPINTILTEKELKLERLEIPLDTDVYIDDEIDLDLMVPLDTKVETLLGVTVPVKADIPVKMKVPVRQKVRIKDTLVVRIDSLSVPLNMVLPLTMDVPLKQNIKVSGQVEAPISQVVKVPLEKTIHAKIPDTIPVAVELQGTLPVLLQADFASEVNINSKVPVQLGQLELSLENLNLHFKKEGRP